MSTGIRGLDHILGGGITPARMYLLEGSPGTGKTTFGLQFLMTGQKRGEKVLYITLSETREELEGVVASHGWTLDGIDVFQLGSDPALSEAAVQSILHPSEVELGETIRAITAQVERINPVRVVFDSLSEMRLLARDPLRYRRQILSLKQFFSERTCTVLLLDDKTSEPTDLQLHSLAHGVISLDHDAKEFGAVRRALRVVKMRGIKFLGGWHDVLLDTGRIDVFPRLVAADHHAQFDPIVVSSGSAELDAMMGGGLTPGTSLLLLGPSGAGKTTTAVRCLYTALARQQQVEYFLFDESRHTLLARSRMLDMPLEEAIEARQLYLDQIDPASITPGEFAARVVEGVSQRGSRFVVIDSLNAYVHAMPGRSSLVLHMHELLMYLNQMGVITILIVGQRGLVGDVHAEVDLSYLSDTILLYRFFEARGQVRTAISLLKSRTAQNERLIRELKIGQPEGIRVGVELVDFEGILSGAVAYRGSTPMLSETDP